MDELTEKEAESYEKLRERSSKILKAMAELSATEPWQVFKELVLDEFAASIERQIDTEARKEAFSQTKLHLLQGERNFAKRLDIQKLATLHRSTLEGLNKKLKDGNTNYTEL